eukprot:CAMPEP_0201560892 /NCGR_PEP_ID=MMETSP0173_2-20130828/78504_1 /ASSEMBLY_ACC=CAM_ASM_000268 /TAXON_ID=218659 /ORGANISM="Vexillifera sp., Strain DIVA3 564/2" /LENGTH=118 /DNA_ID=CAMNT_0047975355 /DNA_START=480 /DNA_END=837 /DNA_ORIENTATION=-
MSGWDQDNNNAEHSIDAGTLGSLQQQSFTHKLNGFDDTKLQDLGDVDNNIITDANREVQELAKETAVAAEMFADVSQQVAEQGEMLDAAEDNLMDADEKVTEGVEIFNLSNVVNVVHV